MARTRRFRVAVIATMVAAITLVIAAFSVSLAAWSSGGSSTATAEGNVGQFYVEYPQYVEGDVALDESTYYVRVAQVDAAGIIEAYLWYPMQEAGMSGDQQQYSLISLSLDGGENATLYKGGTVLDDVQTDWSWASANGTLASGVFTAAADGKYDFYLKLPSSTSDLTLYVGQGGTGSLPEPVKQNYLNQGMTVRTVNASTTAVAENEYEYHNYICISRTNNSDASIAFIEFSLEAMGDTDLSSVGVKSVTLTRRKTDKNGKLDGDNYINPAPRLYNLETVEYLDDIGCGDLGYHGVQEEFGGYEHVVEHYAKGIYCILFFSDNSNQYYALDITIVTDKPADFKLTATASNTNHWQRFEAGYGEPWGFYLGGLVNNVWLWDPRRTTMMSGTVVDGENDENLGQTQFTEIDGSKYDVLYPKQIDLTLTVNLTAGSLVKLYMIDKSGNRLEGQTAYILPKKIVAPAGLYGTDDSKYNTDASVAKIGDINLRMPVSAEYTFRFVGSVSVKTSSDRLNLNTGEYRNDGTSGTNWYGIPNFNFLVDTLYITTTASNSNFNVTFDANGGTFADGTDSRSQSVKFGGCAVESEVDTPSNGEQGFVGWYTEAVGGTAFDFGTPITSDTTLYAHWRDSSVPYTMVVGGVEYALEDNTDELEASSPYSEQYKILDHELAKNASITFKYGATEIPLVIDDWAANILLATGGKSVTVVEQGFYSLYIGLKKGDDADSATYVVYSKYTANADAANLFDIYVHGTWGTGGGENATWSARLVASNVKVGSTVTLTFNIPASTKFGIKLTKHGTDEQVAWGAWSVVTNNISGKIYNYDGSDIWTGGNSGRYTFTVTVSGTVGTPTISNITFSALS